MTQNNNDNNNYNNNNKQAAEHKQEAQQQLWQAHKAKGINIVSMIVSRCQNPLPNWPETVAIEGQQRVKGGGRWQEASHE